MKRLLTCTVLSIFLLSGCTVGQGKNDGVISVNGTIIKRGDVEKLINKEIDKSFLRSFGGSDNLMKSDDNPMYIAFKQKVSKEAIVKTLIEDEIAKRGIEATETDVENEMKTVIDRVGSKEELNSMLKKRGISNNEFLDDLKTQIKIKKLVNSIEKINITDADAQKYYNENKAQFTHGEQVRASHILVSCDTLQLIREIKTKNKNISTEDLNKKLEEHQAKQLAKAEALLKEVKANPDNFAQIAQKNSDDRASGEKGGELGFFSKEQMVPVFSNAAFAMKPNTVSDNLVKSNYGYHIIKVTDRIEGGTTPFVKVKDEIKFYLETQEQIRVLKKLTEGLQKTAKIEYLDNTYNPNYEFKPVDKKDNSKE